MRVTNEQLTHEIKCSESNNCYEGCPYSTEDGGCTTAGASFESITKDLLEARIQRDELLKALKGLKNNYCFCEAGIGNPMFYSHTEKCKNASDIIAKIEVDK